MHREPAAPPFALIAWAVLGLSLAVGSVLLSRRARADASPSPRASAGSPAACPDTQAGETALDCPWAGIARALVALADSGQEKQIAGKLKELAPDLDRELQSDSRRAAWRALWGRSINFDELASGLIVHPAILAALGERFGYRAPMILENVKAEKADSPLAQAVGKPVATDPAGHPLAHAGLEHTYGYLFSLLRTKFGYKRARWVDGDIEKGFGLKEGLLGPRPETGTLFANATYFAGQVAFRGNKKRLHTLEIGAPGLPSELRDFDYAKLSPQRLVEEVEAKDSTGQSRKVRLRTDLVPFIHPRKNTHLLIYSVSDPAIGDDVLITLFPVDAAFVRSVLAASEQGEGKPIHTRYNAFVEGVTGAALTGSRKIAP